MKITLLQPPSPLLLEDKVMVPVGLLTLGALLKERGHEVNLIDLAGIKDWKSYIKKESYKLDGSSWYGISASTPQYGHSKQIVDYISTLGYSLPSVVGGMHITSECYSNNLGFLTNDNFSSYVNGEGYNTVLKICEDIKSNQLKKLYTEPIWKDVNTLPYADRDLVDMKNYKYTLGGRKGTNTYFQYGCYYSCSYCESRMAGSYVVRAMHPKRCAAEMEFVKDRWNIDAFLQFDDEMNLDRSRFLKLCDEYGRLDVFWRGFLVTAKWDEEMAIAAKKSGCYQVASGIESFSNRILRTIKKPATAEINKQFIRTSKKAGLSVKCFLIVGLPSEDWNSIYETYKALKDLKEEGYAPDDIDVSILTVYHGSDIFKNRDKLDIKFEDYNDHVDKLYYKSTPGIYEDLIKVETSKMTKFDIAAARNFLESEFKKKNWIKEYSDRKDLDTVYQKDDVRESIEYARKKLQL